MLSQPIQTPPSVSPDQIWERFLGASSTLGPTAGTREAWHKGRERYAVWLLHVNAPEIAERAERIVSSLGDHASAVPQLQHHITIWVCGFPLAVNTTRPKSAPRHEPLPPAGQQVVGELLDDDVEVSLLSEQAAMLRAANVEPFELCVHGVNAFLTAPFLEISDPSGGIERLRSQLAEPLRQRGLRELRFAPYLPHLTVAHFVSGAATAQIARCLQPFRQLSALRYRVTAIELVDFCAKTPHSAFNLRTRVELAGFTGSNDQGVAAIRRGDVFWLAADPERGSLPGHPHPHVVVSDDVFNRSRVDTVIVCALTTNLKRATEPGNVLLEVGEGELPKQSVLVVSQVSSVKKSELGAFIGTLAPKRVEQALDGMRFLQASFFGER